MTHATDTAPGGDALEVLTFDLQRETFALEAILVREILDPPPETAVPGAADFVDAVINFRGKVIPVADLRVAFGLTRADPTPDSRVVVVEFDIDGEPTLVGLRADKVHEVAHLPAVSTREAPTIGMRWRRDYVRRLARRNEDLVVLPDLSAIFACNGAPSIAAANS